MLVYVFLMLSSKSFMVSYLIIRSLSQFKFIFVYGMKEWTNFIDFHVAFQLFQHLLKRLHFLPCISQLLMLKMIHKKRKKGKSTVLFLFQSSVSLRETVCVSRHEIKMVE